MHENEEIEEYLRSAGLINDACGVGLPGDIQAKVVAQPRAGIDAPIGCGETSEIPCGKNESLSQIEALDGPTFGLNCRSAEPGLQSNPRTVSLERDAF